MQKKFYQQVRLQYDRNSVRMPSGFFDTFSSLAQQIPIWQTVLSSEFLQNCRFFLIYKTLDDLLKEN